MEGFFSTVGGFITIATIIIAGGVAVYAIIDKTLRDRRKEALEAADGLIDTLKETITELEERLINVETEHEKLTKAVGELKSNNETLVAILQGRDEGSKQFQQKVLSAVEKAEDTNKIVRSLEASVATMVATTTKLIKIIGEEHEANK